ncbi:MAG: hypothetical protein IAE78_32040 [Myxococcus sp.]|nr:hypothetical protein [Myxococcus sp.]
MMPTLLVAAALAGTPHLAAPGLQCSRVDPGLCDAYLEHFVSNLSNAGIKVTTKNDMAQVMSIERQKSLLGCSADAASCLAELAGALGVASVLSGTVARLESGFVATLKVISAEDGTTRWSATKRVDDERALFRFFEAESGSLAQALTPKTAAAERSMTRWIPAFVGGAVLLSGVGLRVAAGLDANTLRAQASMRTLSNMEIDAIASRGSTLQTLGWAGVGVGAAAIAASVLWVLLDVPPTAQVAVLPTRNGLEVGLSLELP